MNNSIQTTKVDTKQVVDSYVKLANAQTKEAVNSALSYVERKMDLYIDPEQAEHNIKTLLARVNARKQKLS